MGKFIKKYIKPLSYATLIIAIISLFIRLLSPFPKLWNHILTATISLVGLIVGLMMIKTVISEFEGKPAIHQIIYIIGTILNGLIFLITSSFIVIILLIVFILIIFS